MNDGHNTDDEHRAAEYALGLLEGEELLAARAPCPRPFIRGHGRAVGA